MGATERKLIVKNWQLLNLTRLFLIAFAFYLAQGCDTDATDNSIDSGPDASDDAGPMTKGFTCVACHIDKELLLADLKADPLPEPDEPSESEGEG